MTNMTSNQCEDDYDKQIKQCENVLNKAVHETENIQVKLDQLVEEKASHDKKSVAVVNSLKRDYEKRHQTLQAQLNELHDKSLILNRSSSKLLSYCFYRSIARYHRKQSYRSI